MFFHEYRIPLIFDYVEEAAMTGIEFWLETPHFWIRELPVDELQAVCREHPGLMPITVHAPVLDLNPCSINPGVAALSIQYALTAVEIAERLGAEVVTLHPGKRTAKRSPSEADYERFEYYISQLHRYAEEKNVRVAMENMEPKVNSLLCSLADVVELLDREPWLNLTLDIAHAMANSIDEAVAFVECCHRRLANVHVSTIKDGLMHLPPSANGDISRVLESLKDHGYDGHLTLEIEDRNFNNSLSSEEKITLLSREVAFLQNYFE
jgi:sugar phosphate isomerase/epimerase